MPEKTYPPRFDFKKLEPDVPVEFTLLRESRSGKATKDGEEYEWHLWPVKHTGIEMSLFTPNERVHAGLQYLKVKPQDKFTLIKKASVNTETGKPFIYYHIQYGEESVDTKDSMPLPAPKTEADPLADTPPIMEPKELIRPERKESLAGPNYVALFERYYASIMDAKLEYILAQLAPKIPDTTELLQTLWELDKSTSANVSTILIQNGGKR